MRTHALATSQARRRILLVGVLLVASVGLGSPSLGQTKSQGGVPSQAPGPIKSIVPSRVPPLQRTPPSYPNTGPALSPTNRPSDRPVVVYPPGYRWRFDRPDNGNFQPGIRDDFDPNENGSVGTDHWRVKAHLGSPIIDRAKQWYWWRYPYWGYSRYVWWNDYPRYAIGGSWDYTDQFLDYAGQLEVQRAADERRKAEAADRERFARLSELERGDERLSQRKPSEAINHYLKHLESAEGDTEAMRSLAVALIDDNQIDKASAILALAYDQSPVLVRQPMETSRFPGTASDLRDRLTSLVNYANRTGSASAWLSATVLAQAEQRDPAARNMITKAKAAGLRPDLVVAFEQTLKGN